MSEAVGRALGLVAVASMAACLSAPPNAAVDDDGGTVGTDDGGLPDDAGPSLSPAVLGNVLMLSFDAMDDSQMAWDRSGNSRHGRSVGAPASDCPFGDCVSLTAGDYVLFAPDPGLGRGAPLTIEAWVKPSVLNESATVFNNFGSNLTPVGDYTFELTSGGGLHMASNDRGERVDRNATSADIPLGEWTHAAMSWDGQSVSFYQDGELVGESGLDAVPILASDLRNFYAGRRTGGSLDFVGSLDEIKVSDWAKSQSDIKQSMSFDSAALLGRCGDHIAEDGEICDGQELCCQPATCTARADDTNCAAIGGSCAAGRCVIDEAGRTSRGLVALYEFDVLVDGFLPDTSSVDPPLDLELLDGAPTQVGGYMIFTEPTRFRSAASADKITEACKASQELSVEAWVKPADDAQRGPARVVTMSDGILARNFTLGQIRGRWAARVNGSGSDANGLPDSQTATGEADPASLSHVVLTVTDSERRLYVDGRLRARGAIPGGFGGWQSTFPLLIGNEESTTDPKDERPWLGEVHLVAVYCAALAEDEVAQNYSAGADP